MAEDFAVFAEARLAEAQESAQGVIDGDYAGNPTRAEMELREIAAKRALLSEHAPDYIGMFGERREARCQRCITDRNPYPECWEDGPYPCQTLRITFAVYDSDPDYRPEWASSGEAVNAA